MDIAVIWGKVLFLITHVTVFELPLVLLGTAATAYGLARILDKHNARAREARLARRIAVFYVGLFVLIFGIRFLVT